MNNYDEFEDVPAFLMNVQDTDPSIIPDPPEDLEDEDEVDLEDEDDDELEAEVEAEDEDDEEETDDEDIVGEDEPDSLG